jgi:hypothetical protein
MLLLIATTMGEQAATYEVAQRHLRATDDGPGSTEQPWKTISRAAREIRPGDTILVRDGTYRERVVVKTSGTAQQPVRFIATAGAHVVLTGADRLTGWRRANPDRPAYQVHWPYRFIPWSSHMTHPDDEYHRLIGRCEQVAIEGQLLHQVLAIDQLNPGSFFADTSNQVLHVWDPANRDLNRILVEASVRQEILRVEADYVEVHGFKFQFAANMAQHGAVVLAGLNDLLEDCKMEDMNSSGATFSGRQLVIRRCAFRDNGQIGFGANGAHQLLFTECLVENNNTKGFDRGWEAGGDKLVLCRGAVLERSKFVRNRGNGIWFDIGNEDCTVHQCLIADNEDSGIFDEISYGLHATDNVIVGNGFATTGGAWGAQAGISLSSSPDSIIERNVIAANREGFNFREQKRTTPRIGAPAEVPIWNHEELIRHNIIAFNRDAQIWGWFDMKDNRHWPAGARSDTQHPGTTLTLEQLSLRFENNIYFTTPGQGWFAWGVTWGRHKSYAGLAEFQADLGIDKGGRVLDPGFSNISALDFRVSQQSINNGQQNYPRDTVPGVLLGVLP